MAITGPLPVLIDEKKTSLSPTTRLAYWFIAPSALIMLAITFYPLVYGIWMSFTNFKVQHIKTQDPAFVGLQNYWDILSGAAYLDFNVFHVLLFNFIWTIANLVFHVGIGVALALMLNTPGLIGKRFYRAALILPWAVPVYVTSLVWRNMFDGQFGAINHLLKAVGLPGAIDWLANFPEAFYAALLANVWLGFPFMMMVASGALQSIPQELYEAASVDGATPWQRFWRITVPMLQPAMLPAILLGFIWTFNNFNAIYFVTGGGPLGKTEILVTQAYKLVTPLGLYGVAAAFAVLIFALLFVFSIINNRILRRAI